MERDLPQPTDTRLGRGNAMADLNAPTASSPGALAETGRCDSGWRHVIDNPAVLGGPTDHHPGRWYLRPFPVIPGIQPGAASDAADEAEPAARLCAVRDRH